MLALRASCTSGRRLKVKNASIFNSLGSYFGRTRVRPLATHHSNKKYPTGIFLAVVIPEGVEPSIFWMRTRRPGPLDDGTNRYWRVIFPIFFVILIWHFSAMNGENSNNQSLDFATSMGISNIFARKLAHFVLFGALGYSISSFVKGLHPTEFPNFTLILYPIILCVAYGAIDEVHQLTIIGRNATASDVSLESCCFR